MSPPGGSDVTPSGHVNVASSHCLIDRYLQVLLGSQEYPGGPREPPGVPRGTPGGPQEYPGGKVTSSRMDTRKEICGSSTEPLQVTRKGSRRSRNCGSTDSRTANIARKNEISSFYMVSILWAVMRRRRRNICG